ncbi:hypothetical protein SRHO_G00290240 [Serrasalmus rhombeus]
MIAWLACNSESTLFVVKAERIGCNSSQPESLRFPTPTQIVSFGAAHIPAPTQIIAGYNGAVIQIPLLQISLQWIFAEWISVSSVTGSCGIVLRATI